jgi:hypothetical protein
VELQQLEDAEILPGDVVFFCADDWVGEVIAGVTGSEFCHVALAFDDCDEQTLFIECQGGTPKRVVDKGFYAGRQVAVLCGPHWFEIRHKAVEGLGRVGYDYLEAGLAGLADLLARQAGWQLETHAGGHICSTFVAQVLGVCSEVVSPGDLFRLLVARQQSQGLV